MNLKIREIRKRATMSLCARPVVWLGCWVLISPVLCHAEPPNGAVVASVASEMSAANYTDASNVEVQVVDVERAAAPEVTSRRCLRIRTLRPLRSFWDAQIAGPTTAPVHRGQPGLLTFWARTVDVPGSASEEGRVAAYFQRSSEPWDKSFMIKRGVPRRWTLFQIPFRVHESFAASEAQICLGFGFDPQAVEVADVSVQVFPSEIELDALPSSPQPEQPDSLLP